MLREGPHQFVITVYHGDSLTTFPGGSPGAPTDWNYSSKAVWQFDVVSPTTPLRVFDPATDAARLAFTRIGDAGRRGLFRVVPSTATGQPALHFELPVDSASGWTAPDYTASLVIKSRVVARRESMTAARDVRIRVRALGPHEVLHVTLMEDDGTSWTAPVTVDSAWADQVIRLDQFTIGHGVLLPEGFPGEWNYWVGPAAGRGGSGDHLRPEHLERLQLSLRREDGVAAKPGNYGVEVEWIALGF